MSFPLNSPVLSCLRQTKFTGTFLGLRVRISWTYLLVLCLNYGSLQASPEGSLSPVESSQDARPISQENISEDLFTNDHRQEIYLEPDYPNIFDLFNESFDNTSALFTPAFHVADNKRGTSGDDYSRPKPERRQTDASSFTPIRLDNSPWAVTSKNQPQKLVGQGYPISNPLITIPLGSLQPSAGNQRNQIQGSGSQQHPKISASLVQTNGSRNDSNVSANSSINEKLEANSSAGYMIKHLKGEPSIDQKVEARRTSGQQSQGASSLNYDGMQPKKPYHFAYAVKNKYGSNFNQEEKSDGRSVQGQYRVHLPDGRIQTVSYYADWKNGYNAVVSYEGKAKKQPGVHPNPNLHPNPVSKSKFVLEKEITLANAPVATGKTPVGQHPSTGNGLLLDPQFPKVQNSYSSTKKITNFVPLIPKTPLPDKSFVPINLPSQHAIPHYPVNKSIFPRPLSPTRLSPEVFPQKKKESSAFSNPVQQSNFNNFIPGKNPTGLYVEASPHTQVPVYYKDHQYKITHPYPGGYSHVMWRQTLTAPPIPSPGGNQNNNYYLSPGHGYSQGRRYASQYPGNLKPLPSQTSPSQVRIPGNYYSNPPPPKVFQSQKQLQVPLANSGRIRILQGTPSKEYPGIQIRTEDFLPVRLLQTATAPAKSPGPSYLSQDLASFATALENPVRINGQGVKPSESTRFPDGNVTFDPVPGNQHFRPSWDQQVGQSGSTGSNSSSYISIKDYYQDHPSSGLSKASAVPSQTLVVPPPFTYSRNNHNNITTIYVQGILPEYNSTAPFSGHHQFIATSILAHMNSLREGNPIPAESVIQRIVQAPPDSIPFTQSLRHNLGPSPKVSSHKSTSINQAETGGNSPNSKYGDSPSFSGKVTARIGRRTTPQYSITPSPIPRPLISSTPSHKRRVGKGNFGIRETSSTTVLPNVEGAIDGHELYLVQLPLNKTGLKGFGVTKNNLNNNMMLKNISTTHSPQNLGSISFPSNLTTVATTPLSVLRSYYNRSASPKFKRFRVYPLISTSAPTINLHKLKPSEKGQKLKPG